MRRIAVLDAPSNLGLRPPTATSVPGCAKAPGALRDHGLLRRLNARDAGCLTPPRYDPGDWRPGDGVCHAPEISAYSRKLADRIGAILDQGEFPVVLGGDCSIVLGSALAMHRLGEAVGGRIGLVFVDGHSDFRHPGNASYVGAAAGEDLALVTGRGQTDLAAMEGRRPYYRDIDVVVMGIRAQDEYRLDLQAAGIVTRPVPALRVEGAARSAQWARDQLVDCAGYWVHIDVDVLDPAVMPAVDAPEPGGIAFPELEILLAGLVESPHCLGVEITVFDPDYDPDGKYAEEITSAIVAGLKPAQLVDARPDLVAARRDLAGPGRLGRGRPGPDRLSPDRLSPDRPGSDRLSPDRPGSDRPGSDRPGSDRPGSDADRFGAGLPTARSGVGRDPVEVRRAAAAGDDVRMAAAGMSGGGPGDDASETAAPATTLLGVEEAGEVAAHPAAEAGIATASDQAEFEAFSRGAQPPSSSSSSSSLSSAVSIDASSDVASEAASGAAVAEIVDHEPADDLGVSGGPAAVGLDESAVPASVGDAEFDAEDDPEVMDGPVFDTAGDPVPGTVGDADFDVADDPDPMPADDAAFDAVDDPETEPGTEPPFDIAFDAEDHAVFSPSHESDSAPGPASVPGDGPGRDVASPSGAGQDAELAQVATDGQEAEFASVSDAYENPEPGDSPGPEPGDSPESEPGDSLESEPEPGDSVESRPEPGDGSQSAPEPGDNPELEEEPARAPMRPLGSAPMLDSKPLPATMPGMLRPRTIEDFTLPAQRPAFEVGPEQPADFG